MACPSLTTSLQYYACPFGLHTGQPYMLICLLSARLLRSKPNDLTLISTLPFFLKRHEHSGFIKLSIPVRNSIPIIVFPHPVLPNKSVGRFLGSPVVITSSPWIPVIALKFQICFWCGYSDHKAAILLKKMIRLTPIKYPNVNWNKRKGALRNSIVK
jgi:hypothetical protein